MKPRTKKPNGYWTLEQTIESAKEFVQAHGQSSLTAKYLQSTGHHSLANAIGKHGGLHIIREQIGIGNTRRARGFLKNRQNVEEEIRKIAEESGKDTLNQKWLQQNGHSSLASAVTSHGGLDAVRESVGVEAKQGQAKKKPVGYYTKEATLEEVLAFIEKHGKDNLTQSRLREIGYSMLSNAISAHGGIIQIRKELGLEQKIRPNGYWTMQNTVLEAKSLLRDHGANAITKPWLEKNGERSLDRAIQKHGGYAWIRQECGLEESAKPRGYWKKKEHVFAEARRLLEAHGPDALKQDWLATHGHGSLKGAISRAGGLIWLRKELGIQETPKHVGSTGAITARIENIRRLKSILNNLHIEGISGFTPAQLVVVLQQARFEKLTIEEGKDIYLALTQGLLPPQELLRWSKSDEIEPSALKEDSYYLSGTLGTDISPREEDELQVSDDFQHTNVPEVDITGQEREQEAPKEEHRDNELSPLTLIDPSDQLRFIDSEIFACADEDAIEALISMGLHQLWTKAYLGNEHTAQVVEACQSFDPKQPWSAHLKGLFLEQYQNAIDIVLPNGFDYRVDGELVKPRLMQRHVAALALDSRRLLVMSDMGTGKSLAAQLAVMADGAERILIIAINSCVDQWVYDFEERWKGNKVHLLDMDTIRALTAGRGLAKADNERNVWVIPSHILSLVKDQHIASVVEGLQPDAVILDEIHIFKQREEAKESQRRQQTLKLLTAASDLNPDMMVLGLSGTVITNSLNEGRTLLELVMGEERPDLPTGRGIAKAMRMHQALMANGIRQRATNDFPYVIERPGVDATDWLEDVQLALRYPPRLRPLQVEKALIHARIPAIIEAINGPTVVVTQYVEGFIEPMRKAIKAAGYRVGVHTGDEKLPVHGHANAVEAFKAGELDVLLASINTISTGVDGLQNISNNLVIACMPWTAADYLQVIARLARSGQEQPVRVVIPTTHINYVDDELGPAKWSFCAYRASIIACKQRLMDAVMDGLVPESEEITEAKAGQQLAKWLERLNTKGALVRPSRPIRVPLVFDTEEEETKARARFGSWSSCNGRWNSQASDKLHKRLQANPQEWELYHTDLQEMRKEWDVDPLQEAINHCLKSQGLVIGDFGCGTARLAEEMQGRHVVHSFDHVAINDKVSACDIASGVPLPDGSLDLAIFSLSLMGPDWRDQLVEARRCLKPTGQVLIWSAASGKDAAEFSDIVESTGFKVVTSQCHYKWLHVWAVCV